MIEHDEMLEIYRWVIGGLVSFLIGAFYYLLKNKADYRQLEDHEREDQRIQQMQNERMDRIQQEQHHILDMLLIKRGPGDPAD